MNNCSSFKIKVLSIRKISISTKNTFQSTRKVKTQKTTMCSSWSKRHSSSTNLLFFRKNFNFHVDTKKLNHSWFQKNRTKTHSVISNVRTRTQKHHQTQLPILNRLRLKTWLFSNTVSSNNGVFKGKVFKQKRDNTTNWKSHQENFDSQTKLRLTKPNNNVQSLDYITRYCVYFVLLEVT